MGFFSSRKAEQDNCITDEKSVVQVIRSKFYGKPKDKDSEGSSCLPLAVSTSPPNTLPSNAKSLTLGPTSSFTPSSPHSRLRTGLKDAPVSCMPTDAITMTLAQRLNELAVSNSEGLLSDDEYRLLRQNLFERFASSASVPTETSVVPLVGHAPTMTHGTQRPVSSSTQRNTLSNNKFHVDHSRSPSIRSKTSASSGVTSLLRRAIGRRTSSASNVLSANDTASVFSTGSKNSDVFRRTVFPRMMFKKASDSSLQTEASRTINDDSSVSGSIVERTTSHTITPHGVRYQNLRRMGTPPSSFPAHIVGDTKHPISENAHAVYDEEKLRTVKDIQQEIFEVEAEGRRLMVAFNGLELSTTTREQLRPLPSVLPVIQASIGEDSTWTLIPEGMSHHRGPESDNISVRSGISVGTTPSLARSGFSSRRVRIKSGMLLTSSRPTSLRRKNSVSSVSSQGHSVGMVPPVPALPLPLGILRAGSSSNVSLARSSAHLSWLQEGDGMTSSDVPGTAGLSNSEIVLLDRKTVDIRRRRAEVMGRYETRLEYLRAKLKGAELHEKLLRK